MTIYYDVSIKEWRLKQIDAISNGHFTFVLGDISDRVIVDNLFEKYHFDVVVNLAAQAGVRYSITNPDAYIQSNLIGFYNILETSDDDLPLAPYAVYNIGGGTPENLLDYITTLQEELVHAKVLPEDFDFDAHKELVPMQAGDVPVTYADSTTLERDFGFTPKIGIREGLRKFAEWYHGFYLAP